MDSGNGPNSSNSRCGMDIMAVDMDPGSTPANTATSIGTQEICARIDENGLQDADEDVVDGLVIDVTADNITAANPMFGYVFDLNYSSANLTVDAHNPNFLLNANAGSAVFNISDSPPDDNADNVFAVAVTDPGGGLPEFGDGILSRFTITSEASAVAGNYPLNLVGALHIDPDNDPQYPDSVQFGYVAINGPCGDFDSDGVADSQDACLSLAGVAQNNGCPPPGPPAVGGVVGLIDEDASHTAANLSDAGSPFSTARAVGGLLIALLMLFGTVFTFRLLGRAINRRS
ncbi:MAG: hypothetical protein ACRD2A_05400 [Vicinamibacterales bacterium]